MTAQTTAHPADFSGQPTIETQCIFDSGRFPNLVILPDGALLATWGRTELVSRRSADGGRTWEPVAAIGQGLQGSGTLADEATGDVLAFTQVMPEPGAPETQERFAERTMYRSRDGGRTWRSEDAEFVLDTHGHRPALHFSEHGITLRQGPCPGRLLRPARVYGNADGYNLAVYSDDHGKTWRPSAPFPVFGTGEGAVAELADGTVYYSSRRHYFGDDETPRWQRLGAWSRDGGETWEEAEYHKKLPDGPQYRGAERRSACYNGHFGMAGGLTRLPLDGQDVLIYSNVDQPKQTRHRMSVWASFDGGRTWPVKRLVSEGPAAYSSLTAGQPDTPGAGWIYLLYEQWGQNPEGKKNDSRGALARFNLAWLLRGETTGDGEIPGTFANMR
jgi:sialidase-1